MMKMQSAERPFRGEIEVTDLSDTAPATARNKILPVMDLQIEVEEEEPAAADTLMF